MPKFFENSFSYFDYINSWELTKRFKNYEYYENYNKNIWKNNKNIKDLYEHIMVLWLSIFQWIKINYHFYIKNTNNFMFHNMLFYYWNRLWDHDMIIMYMPVTSHIVKGLEIFDYIWNFMNTNWFFYKIKHYYIAFLGDNFKKKKKKKWKKK